VQPVLPMQIAAVINVLVEEVQKNARRDSTDGNVSILAKVGHAHSGIRLRKTDSQVRRIWDPICSIDRTYPILGYGTIGLLLEPSICASRSTCQVCSSHTTEFLSEPIIWYKGSKC